MTQTICRIYASKETATAAAEALIESGMPSACIEIVTAEQSDDKSVDAISQRIGKCAVPMVNAKVLAKAVNNGNALIVVHAPFSSGEAAIRNLALFQPIPSGIPEPDPDRFLWDEAAPFSSALRIATRYLDPTPFSNFWHIPVLAKQTAASAARRAEALKTIAFFSTKPTPCSELFGMPVLMDENFQFSDLLGMPTSAKGAAPFSDAFNVPTLTQKGGPERPPIIDSNFQFSDLLGLPTKSTSASPFSDALSLPTLTDTVPDITGAPVLVDNNFQVSDLLGVPTSATSAAPFSDALNIPTLTNETEEKETAAVAAPPAEAATEIVAETASAPAAEAAPESPAETTTTSENANASTRARTRAKAKEREKEQD